MKRITAASTALGLALLVPACSGGKSTTPGAKKSGAGQKICAAVATADLTAVLGAAPKGVPKDVPGGHGCVWTNGSDGALAAVVYDKNDDLPSGDSAAQTMADAVGLDKGGYPSSSITTSTGKKPVALLLLTSGAQPADTAAQRRISDAVVGSG